MRPEDTRAVIRIKTQELSRQHRALTERVAALRAAVATVADPAARFAALHRGLSEAAAVAGCVFEDRSHADGLAEEIACGTASEAAVAAGVARLSRELDCASRRTAAAVLYGRLFDERESEEVETTAQLAGRDEARAALTRYWQGEGVPDVDPAAMRALFDECAPDAPERAPEVFTEAVAPDEVRAHLHVLARSFDHRAELRAYARRLTGDDDAVRDLAGALTILLRDLPAWRWEDWPDTRATLRWNRTRWRAFLDVDLVPQLLLEVVALRLGVWARTAWLPRTLPARGRGWDALDHARHDVAGALVLPGIGATLAAYTEQAPNAYAGAGSITGEPDHFQQLFALLNADIWWHATAHPDEPLYVAQTDLADFFPALPHATVEALLAAMRVPSAVAGFVLRYLRGPYAFEGARVAPRAGMFPGNTLSRVIGDALLVALDAWAERAARVPLARFLDDVYWVTHDRAAAAATWEAIAHFCRVAGLRPNPDKTGAFAFGQRVDALDAMPARPLRWSFLELSPRAEWVPRPDALAEFAAALRARLAVPAPVRQMVREYNAAVGYLVRGLAPLAPLDEAHVERLRAPLGQVHAALWGPGRGVVAAVRARLGERHPDLGELVPVLPEGWFSWPITAGGLGLYNPASMLAGARAARATWHPMATPPRRGEPRTDANWATAYRQRAQARLAVAAPVPSPAMEGRQRDFVARGGEVRGRPQASLQPYWQWLLETHGPALVEFFGTLRFLPTEVVPVQPIGASTQSLLREGGGGAAGGDDDIPF